MKVLLPLPVICILVKPISALALILLLSCLEGQYTNREESERMVRCERQDSPDTKSRKTRIFQYASPKALKAWSCIRMRKEVEQKFWHDTNLFSYLSLPKNWGWTIATRMVAAALEKCGHSPKLRSFIVFDPIGRISELAAKRLSQACYQSYQMITLRPLTLRRELLESNNKRSGVSSVTRISEAWSNTKWCASSLFSTIVRTSRYRHKLQAQILPHTNSCVKLPWNPQSSLLTLAIPSSITEVGLALLA